MLKRLKPKQFELLNGCADSARSCLRSVDGVDTVVSVQESSNHGRVAADDVGKLWDARNG